MAVGKQTDQKGIPERMSSTLPKEGCKCKHTEGKDAVTAGNDGIIIDHRDGENKCSFRREGKGSLPQKKDDAGSHYGKRNEIQRQKRKSQFCKRKKQEEPGNKMPFIAHFMKNSRRRIIICDKPCLDFITPRLMQQERCTAENKPHRAGNDQEDTIKAGPSVSGKMNTKQICAE